PPRHVWTSGSSSAPHDALYRRNVAWCSSLRPKSSDAQPRAHAHSIAAHVTRWLGFRCHAAGSEALNFITTDPPPARNTPAPTMSPSEAGAETAVEASTA